MIHSPDQAQSIFLNALEIAADGKRAAYVAAECGDDAKLRAEVDELLDHAGRLGRFLDDGSNAAALDGPAAAHPSNAAALDGPAAADPSRAATLDMPPAPEPPGTQIGPYKLREQIGEGGFGVVYVAEQEKPVARKVALKIIKPGMDTREIIARFEAERQALALMDHPNIAKVLDAGTTGELRNADCGLRIPLPSHLPDSDAEDPQSEIRNPQSGRPYFVMELVRGVPITEFCDERKLPTRERLALFIDVCRAVQHAHQKGIIHRDLKPSNVMVTLHDDKPVVKVIDFGISKALSSKLTEKTVYTAYGQMVGTPLYMSPEQAQLTGLDVDTRSDVYSLGVLVYELLTGTTPFDKETLQKSGFDEMRRIIREVEPPRPSARISTLRAEMLSTVSDKRKIDARKLGASLRGELDWIVMKALEKDRNRRYETANAFAMDVQRYLNDEPVLACPPSLAYRVRKSARRNKRVLATGALLGVMLLAASAAVVASALWAASQADARAQLEANANEKLEFNLYLRNIPLAQVEARNLNWGGVEDLLKDCPEHLRGWEWNYLKRLPNAPLHNATAPVTGGISANLDLAFSADGRFLAGPGPDKTVTIWDLITGEVKALKRHADGHARHRVLCVAFRPPDGRQLVTADSEGTLTFWDPESGRKVGREVKGHVGEIVGMTFRADGQLLATIGADDKTRLWDVAKRQPRYQLDTVYRGQARMLRRAAFSPDGRLFACGAGRTVKVWDATTGRPHLSLQGHKDLVHSVAFSPQGDRLLSAGWDVAAKVWDLAAGGRELFTMHGHAGAAWAVEFSPDGRMVAVAGGVADPAVKVYDARTGALIHNLRGHATRVGCVAFHPGGRRLVSCSIDQTVRIWELSRGREVLTLRGHSDLITRVLFDPKGWRLASSSDDGKLRVWDGTPESDAPGRSCLRLSGHTGQVFGVNFNSDGGILASASQDRTVRIWNVAAGRAIHTLTGHTDTVFTVAFGRDGQLVSGSYDGTTKVWNARTGALVQNLAGPEARARGLALSNDGKRLVTSSITPPFPMWRWDVHRRAKGPLIERRPPVLAGHNGPAFVVAFSPDGKFIASAGTDGLVILWDADSGKKEIALARSQSRERAWAVAFHPLDSRRLAAGYSENRVMIWDYSQSRNEPTAILTGHTNDVYCVAYSSDGRWLASASWNEVIIWDVATGAEVRRLGGFPGLIWSVAWSPNRQLLAVGGGHKDVGTIELWDMTDLPARAVAAPREQVNR